MPRQPGRGRSQAGQSRASRPAESVPVQKWQVGRPEPGGPGVGGRGADPAPRASISQVRPGPHCHHSIGSVRLATAASQRRRPLKLASLSMRRPAELPDWLSHFSAGPPLARRHQAQLRASRPAARPTHPLVLHQVRPSREPASQPRENRACPAPPSQCGARRFSLTPPTTLRPAGRPDRAISHSPGSAPPRRTAFATRRAAARLTVLVRLFGDADGLHGAAPKHCSH